jgi:hypothetical protein
VVHADLYIHSFRGSNNRLDEANRDRRNANRLFDSQNNNRGGYNVGTVYYTEGSKAYFQWTNQHSCGTNQNDCELVWQYMCDDNLRDGTSTNRIPVNNNQCYNNDCENDLEYGRQESRDWYYTCMATHRNKGLFTANQNLKNRNDARYTRQNPNGNRYGYECPEERDYYPYWRPSPWIDFAVLTNSPTRCAEYQANSENVVGRWYCKVPQGLWEKNKAALKPAWIPITQEECEALYWMDEDTEIVYESEWVQAPSHDQPAPECAQNVYSRDNQLGNGLGGYMNSFNWTLPTGVQSETCAFRVRYNITTSEYNTQPWSPSNPTNPANAGWKDAFSTEVGEVDHTLNSVMQNDPNRYPAALEIYKKFHIDFAEVSPSFSESTNGSPEGLKHSREYVFKNNPKVDIFGGTLITSTPKDTDGSDAPASLLKLQMNINTNQFGRTFQDRSHRFAVRPADPKCRGTVVHNLQVRGKRGNVVQTYPGMEYDFVPDRLDVAVGECVHIQWTGSNTNPNNNDGQGKQGTDRSNIVVLADKAYVEDGQPANYEGQFGRSFPNHISKTSFLGFSDADEQNLAILDNHQTGGELSELDDAATYFDMGVRKVTVAGIFHYLCTRNNNFSNRSQKGKVVASTATSVHATVGWNGGQAQASTGATIDIQQGTFTVPVSVTMETWPASEVAIDEWRVVSDYVKVFMSKQGALDIAIPYSDLWSVNGHSVFYNPSTEPASLDPSSEGWTELENIQFASAIASGTVSGAGTYVVTEGPVDLALAVMLPLIALVVIGSGVFLYHKHTKGELDSTVSDVKEFFISKV